MGRLKFEDELVFEDCRLGTRAEIEDLQRRSEILRRQDRLLLEMVLSYGMSFNRIAELTGASSRTVSMRYSRLKRLLTGKRSFKFVLRLRKSKGLGGMLLYDKLVDGTGYRQLASKYGVSEYKVRKLLAEARSFQ